MLRGTIEQKQKNSDALVTQCFSSASDAMGLQYPRRDVL